MTGIGHEKYFIGILKETSNGITESNKSQGRAYVIVMYIVKYFRQITVVEIINYKKQQFINIIQNFVKKKKKLAVWFQIFFSVTNQKHQNLKND